VIPRKGTTEGLSRLGTPHGVGKRYQFAGDPPYRGATRSDVKIGGAAGDAGVEKLPDQIVAIGTRGDSVWGHDRWVDSLWGHDRWGDSFWGYDRWGDGVRNDGADVDGRLRGERHRRCIGPTAGNL